MSLRERILLFLHRRLFSVFAGMKTGDWLRLLEENDYAIDIAHWPRAALITMGALSNSDQARIEEGQHGQAIAAAEVPPPLFILGHWRSGTTHLHNLLCLDRRFAFPNNFQTAFPHTFLTAEDKFKAMTGLLMPERRPQDNVRVEVGMPQEDEFGLCVATLCSPYLGWMFPHRERYYDRYLTMHEVAEPELARWRAGFLWFLKKLTVKYGRPMLLKSPPHTARLGLLLDMFPQARFVHIHRDPYTIFQSTRKLHDTVVVANHVTRPSQTDPAEGILRRFSLMYDAFFEERRRIPPGQFCEIAFTDLERDAVGQVQTIYQQLGLGGFDSVEVELRRYLSTVADYRKNEYAPLKPAMRRRVATQWRRAFEEWGY
ncbi:MAG: sulfotransferase [Planctomycetes bacterium]|nr:sulfotransferase [Planctomycetota bacterium]